MRERTAAQTGRKKQSRGRSVIKLVSCLAIIVGIALLGFFAYSKIQESREIQRQKDLKDLFEGVAGSDSAFGLPFFLQTAVAEELPAVVDRDISERFIDLRKINEDIIGWIEVGENISTPVVYRDNEFYLDHDFYGDESVNGTVFVDVKNEEWETDPYLVIYGHNMKNGTMFGTLDEFQKLDYLVENTTVDFYSVYDNEVVGYVPFAVVDASMDKDSSEYLRLRCFGDFDDPEDMSAAQAFIDEIMERSMFEIPGLEATAEDRIIALVTCSYKLSNGRITVFCRALHEGETHEQMEELIRENAVEKTK